MNCPECGKDLGEGMLTDYKVLGWCCSDCNIKIYKELFQNDIIKLEMKK